MRERPVAPRSLARMSPNGATVIAVDGSREFLPISAIHPVCACMLQRVSASPLMANCSRVKAISTLPSSMVKVCRFNHPRNAATCWVLISQASVEIASLATANDLFIAEMVRMISEAEGAKAGFRRIADRAAAVYAPAVHLLSLATFVGWMALVGMAFCGQPPPSRCWSLPRPCALGLAVPIVHVVAAGLSVPERRDGTQWRSPGETRNH
ncbi:MAG: hypothetical protein R3D29_10415 [Nitratireductor sp.]